MKKLNTKGFSVVEVLLVVVLIGAIAGLGWWVWGQNNNNVVSNDTPISTVQDQATESMQLSEFKSEEYKFKFSYPSDWGEVTVEPSSSRGKSGTAYSINFSGNYKIIAGFRTADWVPASPSEDIYYGFTVYGNCVIGPTNKNVAYLHENDDSCVIVRGYEDTEEESVSKRAAMSLEKRFNNQSEFTGVTMEFAPVAVEDFSDDSLNNAYSQELQEAFKTIAKSLKEL
jgi:type II secretory pathway pseudopilin PulG